MKTPMTTIIVDDEPEAIETLKFLLGNITGIRVVGRTSNADTVLQLVQQTDPEVIFLDINMPVKNGFEVLNEIRSHYFNPYIIFTTAYDQYALKAIKAGAFEYLLKPVSRDELELAVKKAISSRASHNLEQRIGDLEKAVQNHRKLRFNTRSGFILIHPDEIFYIEADANYSEIYLSKVKREVVSMNLGAVEEILPAQFIRISRSVIINSLYMTKLSGVNKRCTLKKGDEEVEFGIPEKQMPEVRRKFGDR